MLVISGNNEAFYPPEVNDNLSELSFSAHDLCSALKNGNTQAIKNYAESLRQVKSKAPINLIELLAAEDDEGIPGLYFALKNGHADAIKAWGELFQGIMPQLSPDKLSHLVTLLAAKNAGGISGLYLALNSGHAEVVKAWGEVFHEVAQRLTSDALSQLITLLAAEDPRGISGLHFALEKGHTEAVKAWGELLQRLVILLPTNEHSRLISLLAAKDVHGIPGLYLALENGHTDAIQAWCDLLQNIVLLLPTDAHSQLLALLAAKDNRGMPGLSFALLNGHADSIKVWGGLLKNIVPLLSPDKSLMAPLSSGYSTQLIDLLAAKDANGIPGLYFALQNGHADAIKAWGQLLQCIIPQLPENTFGQLTELLAAKNHRGVPGLYSALQHDHSDAVKAWGDILQRIVSLIPTSGRSQLSALLAAKDDDGISGLCLALHEGNASAIKAWGEVLQDLVPLLPANEISALLMAKNDRGIPALHFALQNGHADAVKIWGELLRGIAQYLPTDNLSQLIKLVAANDTRSIPGFHYALANGHVDAIRAWGELLQGIVPLLTAAGLNQLVSLLAVADYRGTPGLYLALQGGHTEAVKSYGKLLQYIFQQLPKTERITFFEVFGILKEKVSNSELGISDTLALGSNDGGGLDKVLLQTISTWQVSARQRMDQPQKVFRMPGINVEKLNSAALLLKKKDYENAFKIYAALMKEGSKEAIFQLGLMHLNGLHVTRDENKAIELFQLAHNAEHTKAANTIAEHYVKKGNTFIPRAKQWYQNALKVCAPSDVANIYLKLGKLCMTEKYDLAQHTEAVEHFTAALPGNRQEAALMLARTHLNAFEHHKKQPSLDEARKWYRQAADSIENPDHPGYAEAPFQLAKTYIDNPGHFGLSTEEKNEIVTQLKRAHERGHLKAAFALARWHETRFVWPHEKAENSRLMKEWYKIASS
ncbi:MAG: ShET2/EspL2 family type secretion system effector toxin [Solimicrobium sp.]|jgi:TPR repeat protein/ankyrin repeat protein|nr:ShET2/EspL2 family type secretion system effector toxin [Solimicrobium sp.]